jgi:hypothetical protein
MHPARKAVLSLCLCGLMTALLQPPEVTAQESRRPLATLRLAVPMLSTLDTGALQEVTIRWTAYPGPADDLRSVAASQAVNHLRVIDYRTARGSLPLQRNPRLSASQLVVVALDSSGRELGWQLIPDPRIVRAEFPGPSGELTAAVLHRAETDFLLVLPHGNAIAAVKILQPVWTGSSVVVETLGVCDIQR